MSNELVSSSFYDNIDDPIKAIDTLGNIIVKSGMFGCDRMEQGAMIAMACMCEKKDPLQIARTYHIINGSLSKKYDAMLAEFYAEGGKVKWLERSAEAVEATFIHPSNGEITIKITMDELVKSGVALGKGGKMKDTYVQHPANMITARVVSNAMRLVCPSSVCGVYTPEEIRDFGSKAVAPEPAPRKSKLGSKTKAPPKSAPPKEEKPDEAPVVAHEEIVVEAEVVDAPKPDEAPQEPAEAVAVEPDEPANSADDGTILELNPIESEANAYLVNINWIAEGQTYRDLQPEQAAQLRERLDTFIAKIQEGNNV